MDCRFCKIITDGQKILKQTEYSVVILSDPRLMPGHLLVVPKRHIEKLSELTPEERADIIDQTIRTQEKILAAGTPGCDIAEHFRPFIPENPWKVDHLHMHLRPRALDDELYTKVQIYEKEIFREPEAGEFEQYKKILGN